MMERLHQWAQGWVFKLLLAVIMVSLLVGGFGGYFMLDRHDAVAIVNGDKIARQAFQQHYQVKKQRLQAEWGDSFSSLAADPDYFKQLKQQSLEQLINQKLLAHYVNQLALQVDDTKIKAAIREIPNFQKEGKFDNERYQAVIHKSGLTPTTLRDQIKQQLLQQQFWDALANSEFVLPEESQQLLALVMQQREVRLATLPIEPLIAQQILKAGEAEAYYEQHLQDFIAPERIKARFLTFSAEALKTGISVSNQAIEAYYQQHPQRYTHVARQHVSLIRLSTMEQAEAVLAQLKGPDSDFAALAKRHSTDALTAAKGGELGWIEQGGMPPAFDQAAFALQQPGELSKVVQAEDGYYLLRLNQQQPEALQPLQQVRSEISTILRQQQAVEQFTVLQQRVQQVVNEQPEGLSEVEAATGIKAQESDWFTRQSVPSALEFTPIIQTLFDKDPPLSEPLVELINVGGDQAVIVQVLQRQAAAQKPFEQVSSEITRLVQQEKAQQAARQQAEALLLTLRDKPQDQAIALERAGLAWSEKRVLTRESPEKRLVEVLFAHPKPKADQPTYGLAESVQGDIILFELLKVTTGESARDQPDFPEQLLEHTVNALIHTLQTSLWKQAKIKRFSLDAVE
ncbi:peptidylprolyl isomerase [unidentified bacterial endosymbiont]|uniref:peptidylprolyl isomerase n=1 Tax=unidentified bacterial endosymbiont TaxID=2355 RepID=UPI00209D5E4A|nr:peptidylprolyl isomerase [unidentified bacterial endosymbiont]